MTHKQIIIRGLLIHYYIEGEGRTPIIFLHGWRSEAAVWHNTIHQLTHALPSKTYSMYAIDLPGFGKSEIPQHPFTLRDYANIVKEFITRIRNPKSEIRSLIIGHSFGGRIAVKLAAEHPKFIQKLILVGCGGARGQSAKRKAFSACAKIVKPFFTPRFMHPLRKKIYQALGAEDYVATPELKETYLNIINEPLEPLFPRITTQTVIIWGDKDKEAPREYGEKMHRSIRGSRFTVISNAGHFCFLDQPEEFIKIITPFLT